MQTSCGCGWCTLLSIFLLITHKLHEDNTELPGTLSKWNKPYVGLIHSSNVINLELSLIHHKKCT